MTSVLRNVLDLQYPCQNQNVLTHGGRTLRLNRLGILATFLLVLPAVYADLLVADRNSSSITRYDSTTGQFLSTFVPAGSGGLLHPQMMVMGADGNLYVGSSNNVNSNFNTSILEYSGIDGSFLGTFIAAGSGGIGVIEDFIFRANGHAYVGDGGVYEYSSTGAPIGIFATGGDILSFGPDGNLYAGSNSSFTVLKFNGSNGVNLGTFVGAGNGLNTIGDVVFGPDGNLYISTNNRVLKYNGTTGAFISTFVAIGSGGLSSPVGMAFSGNNLFVTSSGSNKVLEYDGQTGAFLQAFATTNVSTPEAVVFRADPSSVPESSSIVLLTTLVSGLFVMRRRILNVV